MAKGYTSAGQVAQHLGSALTAEQETAFDFILPVVEETIDAETGSAWLTGLVSDELHPGPFGGPIVFLRQKPITSVSGVVAYTTPLATAQALTPATDYVVSSLQRGMLYLPNFRVWDGGVAVTYTPRTDLPWSINRAATLMVALMLPGAGGGGSVDPSIVKSYQVGGDLSVTFRDAVAGIAANPDIRQLLQTKRRGLVA